MQFKCSTAYRFAHIQKLVINQDNGPENHSRRTQFMKRIVNFSIASQLTLQLAYYPPYSGNRMSEVYCSFVQ
jgi:hypothetical protein